MNVLQVAASVLTALTALLAAYIAWQQHQISRLQYRSQLFDKRFKILEAATSFSRHILREGNVTSERCIQFRVETANAEFLFGGDRRVLDLIDRFYERGLCLSEVGDKLYPERGVGLPVGPEREEAAREKKQLIGQLTGPLLAKLKQALRPYLTLP